MGHVIAVANRKGGVGKTTTVVSLARTLVAQRRRRVVVVDTDPQASASLALVGPELIDDDEMPRVEDILSGRSAKQVPRELHFLCREQVNRITDHPDVPLSLLACTPRLWDAEDGWLSARDPRKRREVAARFRNVISALKSQYDYILVDTAPGRSFLGVQVMEVAERFLVPCVPDRISTWGLDLFLNELRRAIGGRSAIEARVRVLWSRFNPASRWREYVEEYVRSNLDFAALEDGLGSYTSVARSATLEAPTSFANAYPGEVGPRLLRIAESIMHWCGDVAP